MRFRFAAFFLLGNVMLAPATAGLLTYSVVTDNRQLTMIGSGFVMFILMLVIVQWIIGCRTGCPLCRTPVLAPKACMKHRRARTFLRSHRLRVAVAILLKDRFRCPYCNESTSMERRETIHRAVNRARNPIDGTTDRRAG